MFPTWLIHLKGKSKWLLNLNEGLWISGWCYRHNNNNPVFLLTYSLVHINMKIHFFKKVNDTEQNAKP